MSDFEAIHAEPNIPSAVAPTPATPTPEALPTPAPIASPVATPQVPAAAPIAAPEDRSNWVPPHRIREVREAEARKFQTEQAQLQAQLQHMQRQVQALTGTLPQSNTEHTSIRQQFDEVFGPGASDFLAQREQMQQYVARMQELEQAVDYIWRNHGRQSMDRIYSQASETLGGPLSDEGKRALHAAFTGWVQSVDPDGQRYVNDPSIVDEFWKTLSSTLVDPVRRAATAQVVNRAPGALPQDTPAGVPMPGPAPKPANMDERMSQAWSSYNAYKKA